MRRFGVNRFALKLQFHHKAVYRQIDRPDGRIGGCSECSQHLRIHRIVSAVAYERDRHDAMRTQLQRDDHAPFRSPQQRAVLREAARDGVAKCTQRRFRHNGRQRATLRRRLPGTPDSGDHGRRAIGRPADLRSAGQLVRKAGRCSCRR